MEANVIMTGHTITVEKAGRFVFSTNIDEKCRDRIKAFLNKNDLMPSAMSANVFPWLEVLRPMPPGC
jgi:hypothetical protein